ncbi:hypothetical protein [Ornithinimicrobium pekingense]|uniref:hypothetical protein n=1 Tax=Ornithinimicrobium pekingense TaxID=384677 RepID=UPI0003F52DA6|nr:hypothetical protein [Ornithinimicrobium pekingense]
MKRSRVIPALALTAVLALAGCSGVGSDLGVAVDGEEYSVTELQEATTQLNEVAANLEQPLQTFQESSPQQVVTDLAVLPVLEQIFTGTPAEVTDSQLEEFLAGAGVAEPVEATLEAARSRQYQERLGDMTLLQDPAMSEVVERAQTLLATPDALAAVDVEVNPRYGSWDIAGGGVVPRIPEWIRSTER